jgi:alpha-galactosidase
MIREANCSRKSCTGSISLVVALCLGLMLLPSAYAQSLTGKWVAVDKVLDNGQPHKIILELQQSGNDITGTVKTIGYSLSVTGKATANHFELFRIGEVGDKKERFATGDHVGSDLKLVAWGHDSMVAKPAAADDEIPVVEYIEPPSLHKVPSNRLAKTPPMGWNSWNKFQGRVSDTVVREIADAMVSSGMRDAGYVYLNIDDTWEGVRDAQGVLQPNHKFPDMKALADYVHSKGLKLGIYSSPGPATCAGYPGSYGHEEQDAKTWASWGIDYLKYDWCSAGTIYKDKDLHAVYQKMGDALATSGHPIVYSLCEYGLGEVQKWGPEVSANLWRTTGDINDSWGSMATIGFSQSHLAPYAAPGHWNDPDMLEIGNGHMTDTEYRTHMSLWSLLASPLLAGNDVRSMSPATKAILLNKEVIAIDQDPLGSQATRLSVNGDVETWTRPLADGSVAVGVFNRGAAATKVTVNANDLKLSGAVKARDLWAYTNVSPNKGAFTASVPSHGVFLLRVSAAK